MVPYNIWVIKLTLLIMPEKVAAIHVHYKDHCFRIRQSEHITLQSGKLLLPSTNDSFYQNILRVNSQHISHRTTMCCEPQLDGQRRGAESAVHARLHICLC